MKNYLFTVDDNIRFLKELTEGEYSSVFDHPYLSVYKRLHDKYGAKIQLNLFYESEDFDLSEMTDKYREEWSSCSDWLKMSFHSRLENVRPYEASGYGEVFFDCQSVQNEILRFASESSLAKTTTVHYCLATSEGLSALKDNGVRGLLGLYGSDTAPRSSYMNTDVECEKLRSGKVVINDGVAYAAIDIVLNRYDEGEILKKLEELKGRELIKVMIHEQYFYPDYKSYQPKFEEKLDRTFESLRDAGFKSIFFEELLD